MSVRRYDAAQLLALRASPLAVKPDHLPAIEQWIEYVYLDGPDGAREKLRIPHSESTTSTNATNNQTNKRDGDNAQRGTRTQRTGLSGIMATGSGPGGESSPMGSFSTGRPTLTTRTSALRSNGDDISLGPPRTVFASSRNTPKLSDFADRTASPADATPGDESENTGRSRFFSDRQNNRRSLEKEGTKDSWTTVRERREGQQKDREDRFGKHDKDDTDRRNGFGERHDPRWSSNRGEERRNGEGGRGGWREREQQRRERDGDRGHNDKEPEWMDDPVVKKDQELGFAAAKTQEDFQKWKDSMSKKTKPEPEKEETPVEPMLIGPAPSVPDAKAAIAPLKLDGFENGFGTWTASAQATPQSATTPGATVAAASKTSAKPKTSRFASMFKPPAEEAAPAPAAQPAQETSVQKAANAAAKTSAADQEGFNRVLQMLGSTKVSQTASPPQEQMPASPPPAIKNNVNGVGAKPRSRFTDMFAQKDSERLKSPQQGGISLGGDSAFGDRISEEPLNLFNSRLPERQVSEQIMPQPSQRTEPAMSPAPGGIPFNAMREQQPRPQSGRVNEIMFDAPSRGAPSPDINIQNLLAQNRQRPQHTSSESQQLLNLLRKDSTSQRPPSQQTHNSAVDQAQVQFWLEQQQRSSNMSEPHAPKPRIPQQAPGQFEERLMRDFPTEQQRLDLSGMQEMSQRRTAQQPPPGLNDQQLFLHQQQQHQQLQHQQQQQLMNRRFNEVPPQQQQISGAGRRTNGHPYAPQMQIPQQSQQYVTDYHQITSPGGQGPPPPPGFGPRHGAPAFGNNFHQAQPQQRDGPPPGLGNNNMQGLPPGHFGGPQGIPSYMMRSPTDGMPPPGLRGNVPRAYDPYEMRQR